MATASKTPTASQVALKEALEALMKLGGSVITEDAIKKGDEFQIPHAMDEVQAAEFLLQQAEAKKQVVEVHKTFPYRPLDGAVGAYNAIVKAFGTVLHKGSRGFFGENPPQYVDVEVAHGETIQVPWGRLLIPAIPGCDLELHGSRDPELGEVFVIVGSVQRRYRAAVEGLFLMIEEELRLNSIYKGKAIDGDFNFLDLTRVDRDRVVYAEDAYKELETHILGPIRHGEALKEARVDLKSAVLLHGTYGVGKTLFGYLAAQEAQANGLTFLQVRPGRDSLEESLRTARQYSPCVVFVEDVDTLGGTDQTRDTVSELLEQFDGLRSKGVEVMAILTTNHPERIHKGMVRPGRIDAVIEITTPDAEGVVRLCKTLIPAELLAEDITEAEWVNVGLAGLDYIPAFIHEGCKRAIKYAVVRTNGNLAEVTITAEDIESALLGLRPQWTMMQEASDELSQPTVDKMLSGIAYEAVREAIDSWQGEGTVAER